MKNFNEKFSAGLTSEQKLVLNKFKDWIDSSTDSSSFVLSGHAGTGKTFLSIRLLMMVEMKGLCWTVAAPTHKAVGVLRKALENEMITPVWYPSTIHRLLRLQLKRKRGKEVLEQTVQTANSLSQLSLVLIDEASMIDSNLLKIIIDCAELSQTRLVFVGDPSQLPPVSESKSEVFSISRATKVFLNNVVRHHGPVLKLANSLREGRLPSKIPPCLPLIKDEKGLVGFLNHSKWLNLALESLKVAAKENKADHARILCYTNKKIENLIPYVRRAMYGKDADYFQALPGETLMSQSVVMSNACIDEGQTRDEGGIIFGSNIEVTVKDVTPRKCNLLDLGLSGKYNTDINILEILEVKVLSGERSLSLRLLPPYGTSSRKQIDNIFTSLSTQAKSASKQEGRLIWRDFFTIRDCFASLVPASVLTVHRSQGSTFEKVFVARDVFWPQDLNLRKQLLYVAVTRASRGVWLESIDQDDSIKMIWDNEMRR